jgi:hypothetical protein
MPEQMDTAVGGDALTKDDLQVAFNWLMEQAQQLREDRKIAPDEETGEAIGRRQDELEGAADALVEKQIDLIAGEAQISAEHIDSAVEFADGIVSQVKDIKQKLAQLGDVLDFFAAVTTGSGTAIFKAAITLKEQLGSSANA